ncbi:hypothetical protein EVA_06506 [gut metagenome]|uniref:Uncharacterized protein n=1 Tax=gut metagenome TaxID=749906 RepID=J9GXD4_9ZZZZ
MRNRFGRRNRERRVVIFRRRCREKSRRFPTFFNRLLGFRILLVGQLNRLLVIRRRIHDFKSRRRFRLDLPR